MLMHLKNTKKLAAVTPEPHYQCKGRGVDNAFTMGINIILFLHKKFSSETFLDLDLQNKKQDKKKHMKILFNPLIAQ